MQLNNTTGHEDRTLSQAENFNLNNMTIGEMDDVQTLIEGLVSICESLDDQIGEKDSIIIDLKEELAEVEAGYEAYSDPKNPKK